MHSGVISDYPVPVRQVLENVAPARTAPGDESFNFRVYVAKLIVSSPRNMVSKSLAAASTIIPNTVNKMSG